MLWDTGPLYATFDRDDKHHAASSALMLATAPPLLVPGPVMVEVC
jgi:predicted nucleic acid-binding protein